MSFAEDVVRGAFERDAEFKAIFRKVDAVLAAPATPMSKMQNEALCLEGTQSYFRAKGILSRKIAWSAYLGNRDNCMAALERTLRLDARQKGETRDLSSLNSVEIARELTDSDIARLVAHKRFPAEWLDSLRKALAGDAGIVTWEDIRSTLKRELLTALQLKTADEFLEQLDAIHGQFSMGFSEKAQFRLTFKPNRIRRIWRDSFLQAIRVVDLFEKGKDDEALSFTKKPSGTTGAGSKFFEIYSWKTDMATIMVCTWRLGYWDLADVLKKRNDNHFSRSLLLCVLAIRAYEEKRGALPEKFEDFIPAYLKTVPLGPPGSYIRFKAEPLRYVREGECAWLLTGEDEELFQRSKQGRKVPVFRKEEKNKVFPMRIVQERMKRKDEG
ncbi:MAG: hypothetical protein LBR07_05085 [Puniceicoccales bacterium]|jgi:hypothetical protein|nr:hypothetical protein [Puniceicoccales bacterium]